MKKAETIDTSMYLVETEKALNLLYDHVEGLSRAASPKNKLEILKKILPKVSDFDEHKKLSEERTRLELEIKSCHKEKPLIPEEHREKILSNREIEVSEIDKVLEEQYKSLDSFVEEMEKTLLPLLDNIQRLEERKDLSYQIDRYESGTYSFVDYGHNLRFEPFYGFNMKGIKSVPIRQHHEVANKLIGLIRGNLKHDIVASGKKLGIKGVK